MADHALVVGCDAYPDLPEGDLSGAVADAMAMRDWLLDARGGRIEPSRLTFLASCSAAGAKPDPGMVEGPATRPRFAQAVAE
jgi:hypothetical protein